MKASMRSSWVLVASLALASYGTSTGSDPNAQERGRRPVVPESGTFAVHEWGTFTSVLDPAGRAIRWNPFGFFAPLPDFVHGTNGPKPGAWGNVRMETPVLYVHAERALTLDVRVGFPSGVLTEWYPSADVTPTTLTWNDVEVLPGLDAVLPTSLSGEHYYAARGVAAAHLRASSGETEMFLFYRGGGGFEQPILVRAVGAHEERALELENRGTRALAQVLLFENHAGRVALLELRGLAPGETMRVARSALVPGDDLSLAALERVLRAHGLFEDEAQAMLATWRRDWFEPGLRAFYVMPHETTDELLPLTLTPQPKALERVLVGRLELIEPELERRLLEAARAVAAGSARPEAAFARAGATTRFALAVLQGRYENEPALVAAEQPLIAWLGKHEQADPLASSGGPR